MVAARYIEPGIRVIDDPKVLLDRTGIYPLAIAGRHVDCEGRYLRNITPTGGERCRVGLGTPLPVSLARTTPFA